MNVLDLCPLLLSSFNKVPYYYYEQLPKGYQVPRSGIWNSIMGYDQLPKEYQFDNLFLFDDKTKFAFRILDGYVWTIKLEENLRMNFSFENSDENSGEIIEN